MDGHGTTVVFGTSSYAGLLISLDGPSMSRESIDDTTMLTATARANIPADLYDGGEITLTYKLLDTALPPIAGVAETVTIDWAGQGATHKWAFTAFCVGASPNAAISARMEQTVTLKLTGAITVS